MAQDPSPGAHRVLQGLRKNPRLRPYLNTLERIAESQLLTAVEAAVVPWPTARVLEIEKGEDTVPDSLEDLFRLLCQHLKRVGQVIENDDFSYREIFTKKTPERAIQLWAASTLKLVARGKYSVTRESEVDCRRKIDIVASARQWRVPIEIKPLGPYSLGELKRCISKQLRGRYMQPAGVRYGVLLLALQQNRQWKQGKTRLSFGSLIRVLGAYAKSVGMKHGKVVEVVGIDLLHPRSNGPTTRTGCELRDDPADDDAVFAGNAQINPKPLARKGRTHGRRLR